MDILDISNIVKKRCNPGILIYDGQHKLLYANGESLDLIPELGTSGKRPGPARTKIRQLCETVLQAGDKAEDNMHSVLLGASPSYVYLRAFPIHSSGGKAIRQIMILIEKVVVNHEISYKDVEERFDLTRREGEVLKLVCGGLANKEVADKLSIHEYTVKDHIKNIMRKMGVQSRTAIMNLLQKGI